MCFIVVELVFFWLICFIVGFRAECKANEDVIQRIFNVDCTFICFFHVICLF